jgi:uncharacterized LabA/DUF88 family protein
MADQLYVFVDNSFLFIQGYKHVRSVTSIPANRKPYIDYLALKWFFEERGEVKRMVLVGSELAGSVIRTCQRAGFEVSTLARHADIKSGRMKEKGVDQKIGWEVAKTIFTNKDPLMNKKIILCTGDKDFASILSDIQTAGWAFELWLWRSSFSPAYAQQVEVFGTLRELDTEWRKFIKIGNARERPARNRMPGSGVGA